MMRAWHPYLLLGDEGAPTATPPTVAGLDLQGGLRLHVR